MRINGGEKYHVKQPSLSVALYCMINILLHNLNINIKLKYHDDGILCSHLAVQICSARTEHRYVLSLQKLINWDGNIVESSERVGCSA